MSETNQNTFTKINNYINGLVSNLDVNTKKNIELAKENGKLVLNTAAHVFVAVSVVHFALATNSLLFVLAGTILLCKTVSHMKKTNGEIRTLKKAIK